MAWIRTIFNWLGVALALGAIAGCHRSPDTADVQEPSVLRIAFVPQVDMEERYAAAYRALEAYLTPLTQPPTPHRPPCSTLTN